MESQLPEGGANLFQAIKKMTADAEATGTKIFKLTIGQPTGPALISAREAAAKAVLSYEESMHEYQDNGSPGVPDFAKKFIDLHHKKPLRFSLSHLPIPGIKPMLSLIPMACGHIGVGMEHSYKNIAIPYKGIVVGTMTEPGYPTPAVQCQYQRVPHYALKTTDENNFLFSLKDIRPETTLLMLNYPHNPTGQAATKNFWETLCSFCEQRGIRIFNDAAYAMLAYSDEACTLAEVAQDFPNLSWCEAYSASKVIANGTGWRVGAMVGSPDFIGDIATIKGNTDSGFFAPAAYGVLACMQNDMRSIMINSGRYRSRNAWLIVNLQKYGMKLAVMPKAGFFSLWLAPKEAFGQQITDAEHFNKLMIEKTGVAGVHFGRYIRYSVTAPVEEPVWQGAILNAFVKADVKY